ncbi:MAG: YbjN domain-containing protein [Anaerolineae bacterium]
MGPIFNALIEFFEEDDWEFSWMEGMTALSMAFSGKHGKWMCYAQSREEQQQFVFYSVCPMNAPESKRAAVSEFITRANYGMIIGNFEMDWSDGEIRYKTSIDVEGAQLTKSLIRQMVYANVMTVDRYLLGLMAVMYGGASPADEIQKIESSDSVSTLEHGVDTGVKGTEYLDDDPTHPTLP